MLFASSRDWEKRVQDIINAIEMIQTRLRGVSYEDFASNDVLTESVLYKLIVIGEAASNIPDEIRARTPNLPWREMTAMRNIIAHEYFRVDSATVWETACNNLPVLIEPLKMLLTSKNQD